MSHLRIRAIGFLLGLACAGIFLSAEATAGGFDADKLVGTWELSLVNGKQALIPIQMTFLKNGGVRSADNKLAKGTFKINGDTLTIVMKIPKAGVKGRKVPTTTITTVATLVKLTDNVMVMKSKKGTESEYKRIR